METHIHISSGKRFRWFKSYYVVWKLIREHSWQITKKCLNRTMQYGNCSPSYNINKIINSLNRTMQYGNHRASGFSNKITFRLNRTMQYGNHSAFFVILCGFTGLNRTMQYGNLYFRAILRPPPQFKSYYVVWKLFLSVLSNIFFLSLNRTMQYGNPILFSDNGQEPLV